MILNKLSVSSIGSPGIRPVRLTLDVAQEMIPNTVVVEEATFVPGLLLHALLNVPVTSTKRASHANSAHD